MIEASATEAEAEAFLVKLGDHHGVRRMSGANDLETAIVIDQNDDPEPAARFEALLAEAAIELVPGTLAHAQRARQAYRRYGRGNHPARLNFGDCFGYALARTSGEPLLFKGADFAQTDITPA